MARVCDLPSVVATLRGKVEFEVSEEGREIEVLEHLLRRAVAETFRSRLGGADLAAFTAGSRTAARSRPATWCRPSELLERVGPRRRAGRLLDPARRDDVDRPGVVAAARGVRAGGPLPHPAASPRTSVDGRPHGLRRRLSRLGGQSGYRYGAVRRRPRPAGAAVRRRRGARRARRGRPRRHLRRRRAARPARRGTDRLRGLDALRRRTRSAMRARYRERGQLDGTLDEVRALLDEALAQERRALFPDPSDDARLREQQLDALPRRRRRPCRSSATTTGARRRPAQTYEQIRELLRARCSTSSSAA